MCGFNWMWSRYAKLLRPKNWIARFENAERTLKRIKMNHVGFFEFLLIKRKISGMHTKYTAKRSTSARMHICESKSRVVEYVIALVSLSLSLSHALSLSLALFTLSNWPLSSPSPCARWLPGSGRYMWKRTHKYSNWFLCFYLCNSVLMLFFFLSCNVAKAIYQPKTDSDIFVCLPHRLNGRAIARTHRSQWLS